MNKLFLYIRNLCNHYVVDVLQQEFFTRTTQLLENILTVSQSNQTTVMELKIMADAQTQALTDLQNAVAGIGTSIQTLSTQVAAAVAALGSAQPNDSAAIETQVGLITTANNAIAAAATALQNAVTPPTPPTGG